MPSVTNHPNQLVVSQAKAPYICGLSPDTWARLRNANQTPPLVRLSERRVGYLLSDLEKWLADRRETVR